MFIQKIGATGHARNDYEETELMPGDYIFIKPGFKILFKRKIGNVILPMYLEESDLKVRGPKTLSQKQVSELLTSKNLIFSEKIHNLSGVIDPSERDPVPAVGMYENLFVLMVMP